MIDWGSIAAGTRVFVNAGCGDRATSNVLPYFRSWREIRVDLDVSVEPDIVASMSDLSEIPDNTVDAVWTAHCIEHLYLHEVPGALREVRRILKPDGFLCAIVPDLQVVAQMVTQDRIADTLYQSAAGPVTPHDVFFGYGPSIARGSVFMAHRCGFTPSLLGRVMVEAGFPEITLRRRTTTYELGAVAMKSVWQTPEQRAGLVAELGI